jgi:hypothetical protein
MLSQQPWSPTSAVMQGESGEKPIGQLRAAAPDGMHSYAPPGTRMLVGSNRHAQTAPLLSDGGAVTSLNVSPVLDTGLTDVAGGLEVPSLVPVTSDDVGWFEVIDGSVLCDESVAAVDVLSLVLPLLVLPTVVPPTTGGSAKQPTPPSSSPTHTDRRMQRS